MTVKDNSPIALLDWTKLFAPKTRCGDGIKLVMEIPLIGNVPYKYIAFHDDNAVTKHLASGKRVDGADNPFDLMPIVPEPRFRPWKPSEVPLRAWFRHKLHTSDGWLPITRVFEYKGAPMVRINETAVDLGRLYETYEWTNEPLADPVVVRTCGAVIG